MNIINELLDKISREVAQRMDETVMWCFELLGFELSYLFEHPDEFFIEIFPNGSRVFYHREDKLFTVLFKTDSDFEKSTVTISSTVYWHKSKEE